MSDKLDFSKPDQLQTRDGRAVRIYATDGAMTYPVHGAIMDGQRWILASWRADGAFGDDLLQRPSDLVAKPARVKGWVNVYNGCLGVIFATKEEAYKERAVNAYQGQIYIDEEIQA